MALDERDIGLERPDDVELDFFCPARKHCTVKKRSVPDGMRRENGQEIEQSGAGGPAGNARAEIGWRQ